MGMSTGLVTVNADSSRACLACGHAVPHSREEYEVTHSLCTHSTPVKYGCGNHGEWKSGKRKGEQVFRQTCADEDLIAGGCFIGADWCGCSEEDRRIAELTKALMDIRCRIESIRFVMLVMLET